MKKTVKNGRLENINPNLYNPSKTRHSEKKFFTVNELAERWRLHRNTILNYVKKDVLAIFKPIGGRIILFPVDAVEEYELSQIQMRKEVNKKSKKKRKALSAPNKNGGQNDAKSKSQK